LSIRERTSSTNDTNANTTEEIRETNSKTSGEKSITSMVSLKSERRDCKQDTTIEVESTSGILVQHDNSNNDTINSGSFAENNRDEVLSTDTRRLDRGTKKRGTSDEDTPKRERLPRTCIRERQECSGIEIAIWIFPIQHE